MQNQLNNLRKPFFILAPMDDVTDTVFRRMVHATAPADLYFTEFVNVDGLQSVGRPNLLKKVRFTVDEGPLILQLWGKNPDNFRKTAEQVADGSLAKAGREGLRRAAGWHPASRDHRGRAQPARRRVGLSRSSRPPRRRSPRASRARRDSPTPPAGSRSKALRGP